MDLGLVLTGGGTRAQGAHSARPYCGCARGSERTRLLLEPLELLELLELLLELSLLPLCAGSEACSASSSNSSDSL